MSNQEIKEIQHDIQQQFVELKSALKQDAEKAAEGRVDVLLKDTIGKINDALDKSEDRLEQAEKILAVTKAQREVSNVIEKSPLAKAFMQFLRREEDLTVEQKGLLVAHSKSLNSSSDPQGGYLVLPELDSAITKVLFETSPIRRVATVKSISSDQYMKPQQTDLPTAVWADRDGEPSETAANTFKQLTIRTHKIYAEPRVSQDLLDDAYTDVEGDLMAAVAESFDLAMNTAFVSGSGVGQPRGFLTYAAGTAWGEVEQVISGSASALTAAGINNLVYALKDGYLANAVFMMKRDTVRLIRLLVDGNGNALWTPAFGSEPATLMGYPVIRANDMPAVTTNSLSIAFGDFRRAYTIVDRLGLRMLRDPYTAKPFVKFYTTRRVGGAVDNFEAIKIQKVAAA